MEIPPTPSGVETVPALVTASAVRYWKRPALWRWVDVTFEPVTYGELLTAVSIIAARMKEQGSGPGKRVAVAITDRFGWGVAYLGVLFTGATAVPIDPLLTGAEIGAILGDADVSMVIHDERIDLGRSDLEYSVVSLKSVWPGFNAPSEPCEPPLPDVTADDIAAIIFTSGTTGQTKGVMLSHGNLVTDVIGVAAMGLCHNTDILLSVLPIHHAFECTAGFLYPLAIGGQVAYARSLKSKDILADLRSTQATVILAVPLLFENIVNSIQRKAGNAPPLKRALFQTLVALSRRSRQIGWRNAGQVLLASMRKKAGLDTLRLLVSGGAALPPWVAEFCDTIGLRLFQGYGLTETSPVVAVSRPDDYRYDTVGPCIPSAEVKILNPRPDGIGEIAVRGPMVMKGYWRKPRETARVMVDGWFKTGDLGVLEPDGHLRISGRSKNVIITGAGKNVYPEEVEAVLCARPEIAEVVVYGGSRPGKIGETVSAVVVPDADWFAASHPSVYEDDKKLHAMLLSTVREACEDLAPFKRVSELGFQRAPFEKTSTRKIKRFLVTQQYGEKLSRGGELWSSSG